MGIEYERALRILNRVAAHIGEIAARKCVEPTLDERDYSLVETSRSTSAGAAMSRRMLAGSVLGGFATMLCVALCAVAKCSAAEAAPEQDWKPLFKGVDLLSIENNEPSKLTAYAMRVDMLAPGVEFLATPSNGDREMETDGLKTSTFLERYKCQVAVNASPFSPEGDKEGEPRDIIGLSVSRGDAYSKRHGEWAALLITKDNKARIEEPPFDLEGVYNAVGGYNVILRNGEIMESNEKQNPRTAAGVSKDGRYLYLLVVDGRQPAHSLGATTGETAELIKKLGADTALNLDGGGSTALVVDDGSGRAKVLNRPIHRYVPGTERVNGNHLGVFAKPLE